MSNIYFYYNFDMVAIILLITIKLLLVTQRQIHNPTQRPFLWYAGLSILTAALNIISIYSLNSPDQSVALGYTLCNLFYISFEFEVLSVYLFFNRRFNMKRNLRIFYLSIPALTVLLLLLTNKNTNILFTIESDKAFSYGPLYFLFWTSGLFYLIDATSYLIKQKKMLQKRKIRLLIFCGFFLVFTTLFHYLLPELQILQFTNAILILIMFVESQSPLLHEDLTTGALNADTFDNYVINQMDKETRLLFIHIKNTHINNELNSIAFMSENYSSIINILKKQLKHTIIFRIDKNSFALTYKDDKQRLLAQNIWTDEINKIKGSSITASPIALIFANIAPLKEFSDKTSIKNAIQWGLMKMQNEKTKLDIYITPEYAIAYERRRIIDNEILKIVNKKPIDFDLQPIFNLKKNTFDSAEALARIKVPSIGYVPCDEFINISESNGTIISIGKAILEEICHVIKTIKIPFENISVNISMIHFMETHIAEDFISILEKNDISPDKITLEITETTKALNVDLLKINMMKLKAAGFKLSLDDFGTGYSSLESLLTLPYDIIKLDRNLLLACEKEKIKKDILKKVVNMIKSLNFEIILEGVETKEQDDIAREIGVDKIQGYYYSKPLDTKGVIKFTDKLKNN
ncbi:MAG: EAL domain-containing protein [Pleomorphochaeta sp.]